METRRMDDLGRVAIPKVLRQGMGVKEGDELEMVCVDGKLILAPKGSDLSLKKRQDLGLKLDLMLSKVLADILKKAVAEADESLRVDFTDTFHRSKLDAAIEKARNILNPLCDEENLLILVEKDLEKNQAYVALQQEYRTS